MLLYVIPAALFVLCLLLLKTEGLIGRDMPRYVSVSLLLVAFAARIWVLAAGQTDSGALEAAVAYFHAAGGFWGIKECRLAFSVPVQYFLALLSYSPENALFLFKCLCLFFEIVVAWCAQRCVQCISVKTAPRLAVFLIVLLLPSGVFQGVDSGSGDSLWWTFLLLAVSSVLQGQVTLTALWLGFAVSFHPFALWIVPIFWIVPSVRRKTWSFLLRLSLFYLIPVIPAILLGRPPRYTLPFWPALTSIFSEPPFQGVPGLYSLRTGWPAAPVGIILYIVLCIVMIWRMAKLRAFRDKRGQLAGLAFASLCAGAFLPWLPIQSLYGAEVLLISLSCAVPVLIPAAVCCSFASALAVLKQLFGDAVPFPLSYASFALFLTVVFVFIYLITHAGSGSVRKKTDSAQ